MTNNYITLPKNLPEPVDDGGCDHLIGMPMPNIELLASNGEMINLTQLANERIVLYAYPMMASSYTVMPKDWDMIPGARGCTPQACDFRDHYKELVRLGVRVFGLSTQPHEQQVEASNSLHLPFPLLTDTEYKFTNALNLPTFTIDDQHLLKRHTLIIAAGYIEYVFYPVFPPNKHADEVINWLHEH